MTKFSFSKYNSSFSNPFGVDTNRPYLKLSDLGNDFIFKVDGVFINSKSKYGSHAVIQSDINNSPVNISMPNGMTETFEELLKDSDAINAIKEGQCFMKVIGYDSRKYNRHCFTADFIEPCEVSTMESVPF